MAFDARIEEQQVAPAHGAIVSGPVQNRGVRTARGNGVVAHVIAFNSRSKVKDAFDDALTSPLGARQCLHDVSKTLDCVINGQLQLGDFKGIFHEAHFTQELREESIVVVGCYELVNGFVKIAKAQDVAGGQRSQIFC